MADHHDGGHVAQPAPQRASLPPMTITRVGNYELGKTIGKGQFGSVKLGIHMITAERVCWQRSEPRKENAFLYTPSAIFPNNYLVNYDSKLFGISYGVFRWPLKLSARTN
jgi:hypothetical protein